MHTCKEKHTSLSNVMVLVALLKYRRAQSSSTRQRMHRSTCRQAMWTQLDTISSKLFLVPFNDSLLMHTSMNFVDADNSYFLNKMPEQPSSCCWISFLNSRKGECTGAFAFSPHLFNYKHVIINKKSQTSEGEKAITDSRKARDVAFLKNCIKQAMRDLTIPLLLPHYNNCLLCPWLSCEAEP